MNSNGDIQLHSQHCNPLQAVDHDVTQKNPKIFFYIRQTIGPHP